MSISKIECPNCGDNILFEISNQSFPCPSCGSVFTFQQLDEILSDDKKNDMWEMVQSQNSQGAQSVDRRDGGAYENNVIHQECPSCGAEVVTEPGTAASFCAFCGGHIVLVDRLQAAEKAPRSILPFKITRERAQEIYMEKIRRKIFLPKEMKKREYGERFQSMYVPFGLYGSLCKGSVTARCENVSMWSDSDYNYTKTDTYEARRAGAVTFENMPFDAAEMMNSTMMHAIEPFELEEITDFSAYYMSGHSVAVPDTPAETLLQRYEEKAGEETANQLLDTIHGYDHVSLRASSHSLGAVSSEYAVFPVWLMTSQYNGKQYQVAINGQTGKCTGTFPINTRRVGSLFAKIGITAAIITFLITEGLIWIGLI